jgi:hypothetical protein
MSKALAINVDAYLRRVLAALAALCTVSAFLYGIFLLEAVAHAAHKTALERDIRTVSSQLSTLETEYLALSSTLTPERAGTLGLEAPKDTTTVFATVKTRSLSIK